MNKNINNLGKNNGIPLKEDNIEKTTKKKTKNKIFTKKNILFYFFPLIIFINYYLINDKSTILELKKKIIELENKIEKMEKEVVKKKIKIALVYPHIYLNGIARFLIVFGELLAKTGKYDVYLINEKADSKLDFKYNKKIKRHILKKEYQAIKDFDEENDIQLYILNNDVSNVINIYHSLGKKVIGIFHGVFLSCAFENNTLLYRSWHLFNKLDSFVHIIPDDYWIYKKFGFNNSIYIPNVNTFENKNETISNLTYKNLLIVGRANDIIKGVKFGILAMAEIVKEVPDAKLTIVGIEPKQNLKDLINKLNLQDNIHYPGFSTNITQFYLNASVLLITSVSEAYPMTVNEAKAYGVPIISFNIDYSPCFQSGVITVEMFNYTQMAKEAIKLLKNYEYRKKKGEEAKLSLNNFETNDEKIEMWTKLFHSLINCTEDYYKLQKEFEKKYYNETLAKEHLSKHYGYVQQFNEYFRCHSFENFTTLKYLNNIDVFRRSN